MNDIHVLLAEDNIGDIILIKEAFEERNIVKRISVVKNGSDALDFIFKRGKYIDVELPDLIILDINLPKINGLEILKKIKNTPRIKQIPVIMLTSSSSKKDIIASYSNHANCFITKPDEVNDFMAAISGIENFWAKISSLPKIK